MRYLKLEKINPIYKELRVFKIYWIFTIGSNGSRDINLRVIGIK
jgi:hypothetical protein